MAGGSLRVEDRTPKRHCHAGGLEEVSSDNKTGKMDIKQESPMLAEIQVLGSLQAAGMAFPKMFCYISLPLLSSHCLLPHLFYHIELVWCMVEQGVEGITF